MPITVEEEKQHIRGTDLLEDYDFDPPYLKRFFTSNIIIRTIARLVGYSLTGPKKLRCTEAGELKVAPVGAGYEYNDTKSGTATDEWSAPIVFDAICSRIDITIHDNAAEIQRSLDGILFQDTIEIPAGFFYSFDAVTHSFKIKNKTAGLTARYQVVGWW